jgi:hypothetical protein
LIGFVVAKKTLANSSADCKRRKHFNPKRALIGKKNLSPEKEKKAEERRFRLKSKIFLPP